jgi:NAD-dependent deacetylase
VIPAELWHQAWADARAWAAAHAQVFFCTAPSSGLAFLVGFALLSPRAAAMGAVAGAVATVVGRLCGYPQRAWTTGLYSYTGVLTGLYWGVLFEPGLASAMGLAIAALAAAPLTRFAYRMLMPHQIPTLALPALALVWLAIPFLAPAVDGPGPHGLAQLGGWSFIVVGLARYSWLLTLSALLGALLGLGTSAVLAGHLEVGLLFNSVATAMGLGSIYLPFGGMAAMLAGLGAVAAGVLWWLLATNPWGWPPLLAPFCLVTLGVLGALRVYRLRRWLSDCPAPLPLESITSPEQSRSAWSARRQLYQLARRARRIGALTGAGVSTEAGLPDVRSAFGLWLGPRSIITLDDFVGSAAIRAEYWQHEEDFFRLVKRARPVASHHALAALHRRGRLSAVVTQNVDGLHQAAGLPKDLVIELHGNIHRAHCLDCGLLIARDTLSERIRAGVTALYCDRCQGLLKGGGVLFGEPVAPERFDAAVRALLASDLWLVLGTSLAVAPASDLVRWAREAGIPVAIVNATPTPHDELAAVTVTADVGAVLLELLNETDRSASADAEPLLTR